GPLDTAMNVALPEIDGRVITVPTSFKEAVDETVRYVPAADRVEAVGRLALRFAALRRKATAAKRVAFLLTNSAGKANRVGNAVGLDAPASLLEVFAAMAEAGYAIDNPFATSDELIHALIDRGCYDETYLTPDQVAEAAVRIPVDLYGEWF